MAADLAMRQEGLPILMLWSFILGRDVKCYLFEDNQAAIRVLESGKNPTMKYLPRTHCVDLAWIVERVERGDFELSYCTSQEQALKMKIGQHRF